MAEEERYRSCGLTAFVYEVYAVCQFPIGTVCRFVIIVDLR